MKIYFKSQDSGFGKGIESARGFGCHRLVYDLVNDNRVSEYCDATANLSFDFFYDATCWQRQSANPIQMKGIDNIARTLSNVGIMSVEEVLERSIGDKRDKEDSDGFVYFRAEQEPKTKKFTGRFKIGFTRNLKELDRTRKTDNSNELVIVGAVSCKRSTESWLHWYFRRYRVPNGDNREWFYWSKEFNNFFQKRVRDNRGVEIEDLFRREFSTDERKR